MPLSRKQRRKNEALARKVNKLAAKRINATKPAPGPFRITSGAACGIQAAEGEGKLATFEGIAYTGAQMRPQGWWNDVIIDLTGVVVPSQHRPALRQHDHEQIVGNTTTVAVHPKDGISVKGNFSGEKKHVDTVVVPAKNGFQWQLSIGADPIRTEFLEAGEETVVNGRTVKGPLTISRATSLGEVSFVPLGADGDTSVNIAAMKGSPMNPFALSLKQLMADLRAEAKAAKYSDEDIDKMSAEEARAALKDCMSAADEEDDDEDEEEDGDKKSKSSSKNKLRLQVDTKQILAELTRDIRAGLSADMTRQREISAACRRHSVTDVEITVKGEKKRVNLAEHAIENEWSLDQVKAHLLDHVRAERPTNVLSHAAGAAAGVVAGGLGFSVATPSVNEAILEAAVLHAARHQFRLEDDSFYFNPTPDGKGMMRRVPERLQREAQGDLKARYSDQVQQAAHTLFKGRIGLKQLFAVAFRANGYGRDLDLSGEQGCRSMLAAWDAMERPNLQAEGASNMSISNILSNVLNKFALQGYLFVEQVWRRFCAIRSVNDFKPAKSINLLGDVMYKQVGSTGELANASINDQAFSNQANMFGRILTMPWMHLANDDLSMLTGAPTKLGQGAGLALNDNIWALLKSMLAGTVNGDDGTSFFRTTSSSVKGKVSRPNKQTGAGSALQASSLATGKALFDNQTDPDGNPLGYDGSLPVLLFGPTNWQTAMALMQAPAIVYGGGSAALQPDKNVWAGYAEPVMSRYMENANYVNSTTAWLLLNALLSIIEVCFLNGVDTPTVLQASPDFQFDRLGISIRGTMPFGSNQQNFRGGVYSVGA